MQQLKGVRNDSIPDQVDIQELEKLLPIEFVSELQNESGISKEYLEKSAPWLRLKGETQKEYQMYLVYQGMPEHTWNLKKVYKEFELYFASETIDELTFAKFKVITEKNQWHVRRYAFIVYHDWLTQLEDTRQQLMQIAEYRKNQGLLAQKATEASLHLMDTLTQKILELEADDIAVKDLPRFLDAVMKVTNMSADAEARLLSINLLLDLHSQEIADMFQEGMEV